MDEVGRISDRGARLLQELMRFKPEGLTANAWAVKAGVSRTIWTDLRRHGNPSRRTMEKLLAAAGSTLAEFEALRSDGPAGELAPTGIRFGEPGTAGWRPAPLTDIPVFATHAGGRWGRDGSEIESTIIDAANRLGQVDRPLSLAADRDAYAVTVISDAMWPRFRHGRRLLVSPAAPVAIGDDVIVQLADKTGGRSFIALIGELVRRTTSFMELRQYNPNVRFRVATDGVSAIHKVVGEAI
jgi:phage repressor protein C with HTH and peptisase S24 domain